MAYLDDVHRAGADVAGAVRLGSWIEAPAIEFLAGERPDYLDELRRPPLAGVK